MLTATVIATSSADPTPIATRAALLAVLGFTALALADLLRRTGDGAVHARTASYYLIGFSLLFVLRVAGQVLVARRAPGWLPPMEQWNLVPYRILLPIQLAFVAVMALIDALLLTESGPLATPEHVLGLFLIGLSVVYAASMAIRYAVRMRRRPRERWFGGTIPIVFHVVLASFLFTLGTYHAAG